MNIECMCRVCETVQGLKNIFDEENEELLLMLRSVANISVSSDWFIYKAWVESAQCLQNYCRTDLDPNMINIPIHNVFSSEAWTLSLAKLFRWQLHLGPSMKLFAFCMDLARTVAKVKSDFEKFEFYFSATHRRDKTKVEYCITALGFVVRANV